MKVCQNCGQEIFTKDGENRCPSGCRMPKKKAKQQRSATDEVMKSLGLTKVRGAMGGTYWE